jgi:hypothetical protein
MPSTLSPASNPSLESIITGGTTTSETTPVVVYVNTDGTLTASSSATPDATRASTTQSAFRLNRVEVNPPAFWSGRTAERGQIILNVNGYSYTSGRLSGSVEISQSFEVVPKCCGLSHGASGNTNLGNDNRDCNEALGAAFGFVFSTALTDDGTTVFNGSGSELGVLGGGSLASIACLGTSSSTCPATVTVGSRTVPINQVNEPIRPPSVFPISPAPTPGSCTFTGGSPSCGSGSINLLTGSGNTRVFDATTIDTNNLPAFCTSTSEGSPAVTTIHCNLSSLEVQGNRTLRILTSDDRRVRFYLPNEGTDRLSVGGQSTLEHCTAGSSGNCSSTTATTNPLQRFQVYGCRQDANPENGCQGTGPGPTIPQTITLNGNSGANGEPFFLYAPVAQVTVNGGGGSGSQFNGMIWTNRFVGNGGVEIRIPGSGVGDILDEFTVSPPPPGGGDPQGRPFIFEFIARATRGFQIRPGI